MFNKKPKIALDAMILAFNPHVGAADGWLSEKLRNAPSVRRITSEYGFHDSVFRSIKKQGINTLFLAVHEYFYRSASSLADQFTQASDFIEKVRNEHPQIVLVLAFPDTDFRDQFFAHGAGRFAHYLTLTRDSSKQEVKDALDRCELWHRSRHEYDVALSFAGEDRTLVEAIADLLKAAKTRLFYDRYEQANLLGKDLFQHFQTIYRDKARYCLIFASRSYAEKLWTNHELRQAQARVFSKQQDYVIPVRIDDTDIPGVNETVGYLDARTLTPEQIADLVLQKLFHKSY